jgi:hypothetical protein
MYGYAKKASLINEIAETALLQIDLLLSFRGYLWALVVCMFPCKEKGKNWSILIFGFGDQLFSRCPILSDIFSSIIYRSIIVVNFRVKFGYYRQLPDEVTPLCDKSALACFTLIDSR